MYGRDLGIQRRPIGPPFQRFQVDGESAVRRLYHDVQSLCCQGEHNVTAVRKFIHPKRTATVPAVSDHLRMRATVYVNEYRVFLRRVKVEWQYILVYSVEPSGP